MERGKALESDTNLGLTTGHSYNLAEPSSPSLYSGGQWHLFYEMLMKIKTG